MSPFRVLGRALPLSLAAACCNHAEPTGSSPTTAHALAPVAPVASAEPAPARPPACLVPLPDAPPPRATASTTCPPDPEGPPALARAWVSFPDAPGGPRIGVEIADNPTTKQRGLMYRRSLPEDQGMLFEWRDESPRTFWMHNTCIPLDMMFIALDGTILGVVEQAPVLSDEPRGVPCPAGRVLEVNAGFTRSHGVKPGQRIVVER